jgi:hypothetical protein
MMKRRTVFLWTALLGIAIAVPAAAQKPASPPSVAHLPLWTVKGTPTREFVPGLTAALLLTTEQREQLAQAWQETSGSAAVAAAARTLKSDPAATEAQKQAARALLQAAAARFQQQIDTILTQDQKALIEWIDSLYAEAGKAVRSAMEAEFAAAKGDPDATARLRQQAQEQRDAAFLRKLQQVLTSEQWAAMTKAAAAENAADPGSGKGKGGEIRLQPPSTGAGKKGTSQK